MIIILSFYGSGLIQIKYHWKIWDDGNERTGEKGLSSVDLMSPLVRKIPPPTHVDRPDGYRSIFLAQLSPLRLASLSSTLWSYKDIE